MHVKTEKVRRGRSATNSFPQSDRS
jgi:hypothetical protein